MSDKQKEFHIGDILSVTTGCLVSPRHIGGVYDILNFMTGESIYTHQIPRVGREAAPVLLKQHPQLVEVDATGVEPDNFKSWLAEQVKRYGEMLPVQPMTADEHESIDPMSELAEKIHPDRIMVIEV